MEKGKVEVEVNRKGMKEDGGERAEWMKEEEMCVGVTHM